MQNISVGNGDNNEHEEEREKNDKKHYKQSPLLQSLRYICFEL